MPLPLPAQYHEELSDDKLSLVAGWLLEELYATEDDLVRPTDSSYGRGCTVFDRQKNRIVIEHASGKHNWLNVQANTFDLVFTIGGIPCRFSSDYVKNPTKRAVMEVSRYQKTFFDDVGDASAPARFCFVIDRGSFNGEEARVVFMGIDSHDVIRCEWKSDNVQSVHAVGAETPAAVNVGKPSVGVKHDRLGEVEAIGK